MLSNILYSLNSFFGSNIYVYVWRKLYYLYKMRLIFCKKIYLLNVNPFRRFLISTNCCACFLRLFLVGISSSSSESNVAGVVEDGNRGKSGPSFVRVAFPSTEVVVIDVVSN